MKADIGLIGLGVMGENLALNMESKGFHVAVYNRMEAGEEKVIQHFMSGKGQDRKFIATYTPRELTESVKQPRKIMMMVKAGAPVDGLIHQLLPHLSPGDVLIDGGNSDFHDTERRTRELADKQIYFIGCGISGGADGALHGPSLMPGGARQAWPLVKDILQSIAARLDNGQPCCEWIGKGGAGHFVKTVHNGIEYGDMQLIAEAYALLRHRSKLSEEESAIVFEQWNCHELDSYLIDITSRILRYREPDGTYLLEHIRDVAGQKGTGRWSVQEALTEGDPLTLVAEAVFARMLSALPDERKLAASLYPPLPYPDTQLSPEDIGQALYAAKIVSYAQGFSLLKRASEQHNWNLDFGQLALIWRKGCIIRSAFLQRITEAYTRKPYLENLLFDDYFHREIIRLLPAWRRVVSDGCQNGIALPALCASLSYFDGLRTTHSPANLIQAQRDYFGAHTYERTDRPAGEMFHTHWEDNAV
ncbi:MAG: decarboxylating NADP(+)-dependent phosphogluconate dehydrogenase [Clostridium sp.]|nr:decarboxylating NADP(+)-dependent phosphogluconate dehydrogenase [Clostridium sp.]